MRAFAELFARLDESGGTTDKTDAMAAYFAQAARSAPADAALAVYFLAGGKLRRVVAGSELRAAALAGTGIAPWLFEECYQSVGDLAETIALLLPAPDSASPMNLADWVGQRLLGLRQLGTAERIDALQSFWRELEPAQRLVLNKLMTGGFRVGVSRLLVIRALAQAFALDPRTLAQRMVSYTAAGPLPGEAQFAALIAGTGTDTDTDKGAGTVPGAFDSCAATDRIAHPYPFFLSQPLTRPPAAVLGERADWLVEWKWDGIRVQLVRRGGRCWLWSRGEELISERFPEIEAAGALLPEGCVIDGELLAWDPARDRPQPFPVLQKRIARRSLSARFLREHPVVLTAFDLLELGRKDIRAWPQGARREALAAVFEAGPLAAAPAATAGVTRLLRLSPLLDAPDWDALQQLHTQSRALGVEGFMLKRRDASYGVGRVKADARGQWWKWKVDPHTVDCVLVYAQRGHGRRAGLYTDYTFAVWDESAQSGAQAGTQGRTLVPFAKAYSGLTDQEIARVDALVRSTTIATFGPVRSVTPTMVFELGFENIAASGRHKSGIAVRFPRILRWRQDKTIEQADTLDSLRRLADSG